MEIYQDRKSKDNRWFYPSIFGGYGGGLKTGNDSDCKLDINSSENQD